MTINSYDRFLNFNFNGKLIIIKSAIYKFNFKSLKIIIKIKYNKINTPTNDLKLIKIVQID